MRILSIDVGIKNLALCVMETEKVEPYYNIKYWEENFMTSVSMD